MSSATPVTPVTPAAARQPSQDPAQTWPPELLLRAQGVRVAIFDVDGVLTDGGLVYGQQGEALKRFHTLDGLGLKLLRRAGIEPVVISGRDAPALRARLAALAVTHAALGSEDKLPAAEKILASLQADWPQVAVMGDDWPDLPLFARAAFTCAPANAHAEARARAHHVTALRGGEGAAREFCDLLLAAAGRYRALLDAYSGSQKYSDAKTSRRQYEQYGEAKSTKYEDFGEPLYTAGAPGADAAP